LLAGDRARYESALAAAREHLDESVWSAAWQSGQEADFDEEVAQLIS
jgi:hypothetical protein